jgi:hypothetical protein
MGWIQRSVTAVLALSIRDIVCNAGWAVRKSKERAVATCAGGRTGPRRDLDGDEGGRERPGFRWLRHGDGGVGGCSYVLNIDIAGLVVLDAPFDLIRERPTVNDVRVRVCRRDGDEGREDQTSC